MDQPINPTAAGQVLIADDDRITRNMVERAVRDAGYETLAVQDGQQAAEVLHKSHCQLVVTDWVMPKLSGIDLCHMARRGDFGRYIYIIMLTSHDQPQDVLDGMNAGADDFVSKPFNPAEIVCRVRAGQRMLRLETAEMTIFAMAKLAESRDTETGGHLDRVREYCRVLTEHLRSIPPFRDRIDDEYVQLIYQTSPLHDIGKVAIPDCVLLNPGRLSDHEFDIMKTHTTHGATTLKAAMAKYPNAEFLRMAHDIALTHHERFDGTGYPQGLTGEAIPLCGRIMALADVYDALTSRRVYKDAFDHQIARKIIIDDRATHFDPALVDAFIAVEDQFIEIHRQFANERFMTAA